VVAGGAGCAGRPEAAQAATIARAHEGDFRAFERWVSRLCSSDTAFASRDALMEVAFAPVRNRKDVAGAWIERRGPDPELLAYPEGALVPGRLAWRRTRVQGWGVVEVAELDGRRYLRAAQRLGSATIVVTMAFVRAPE
jgi:hypothetical protein